MEEHKPEQKKTLSGKILDLEMERGVFSPESRWAQVGVLKESIRRYREHLITMTSLAGRYMTDYETATGSDARSGDWQSYVAADNFLDGKEGVK